MKARINESQVALIKSGQPVLIHIDACPDNPLSGRVAEIAPIPSLASGPFSDVRTYSATIRLESGNLDELRPGLSAELDFLGESRHQVTRVPLQAIRWSDDKSYVAMATDSPDRPRVGMEADRGGSYRCDVRGGEERPRARGSRRRFVRAAAGVGPTDIRRAPDGCRHERTRGWRSNASRATLRARHRLVSRSRTHSGWRNARARRRCADRASGGSGRGRSRLETVTASSVGSGRGSEFVVRLPIDTGTESANGVVPPAAFADGSSEHRCAFRR